MAGSGGAGRGGTERRGARQGGAGRGAVASKSIHTGDNRSFCLFIKTSIKKEITKQKMTSVQKEYKLRTCLAYKRFTTKNTRRYTGHRQGTKIGRRHAKTPRINRSSTAGVISRSVCIECRLSAVLKNCLGHILSMFGEQGGMFSTRASEPSASRPAPPRPAAPPCAALLDAPALCSRFGLDIFMGT